MLLLATHSFWSGDWALVYDSKIFGDFHNISKFFFLLVIYIYTISMGDTMSYRHLFIQAVRPVSRYYVIY